MTSNQRFWALGFAGLVAVAAILTFAVGPDAAGGIGFAYLASLEAPNWYTTQYDKRVAHILQSEGFFLRGTTTPPVEVRGNTLRFFILGRGEASEMSQTVEMIQPVNLGKTTEDVVMADFQFAEFIRHGEIERMSVDFRTQIQEAGAMAMGRKFDRIILQAMDDELANITTIGDGSTAISPLDTTTAKAQINSIGMMSMNEFFCPLPSISWEQLNLYKVFNNADYTGPDLTFANGRNAKTWNGVHYFQLPDEAFTSPATGEFYSYLWNRRTLGFGANYSMVSRITYENLFTSWLYNTVMSGAAKVLQTPGVRRLHMALDLALTIDGA
ncbi:MAG TPA: phage capsid protein [Alphaproteobacteria bacterium]|jgi:hypothetical protein